jgi:periplasmic protein TonB
MDMTLNWSLYQRRESAAQLGTVMVGLLMLALSQMLVMNYEMPVQEEKEPISLTVMAPPVAPDQVVEQVIQTPPPEKIVEPPKEIVPVTDAPAPAIQEKVQPPKPVEPQVQPKGNPDAENLFAQDVRSRIERKKIYPDAARDLGMSGEVEVLYELDRSGNLIRAEIVSSSGSKLLDQAALRAVKTAAYKSFPEDAWLGSSSKVFKTKLVFTIDQ